LIESDLLRYQPSAPADAVIMAGVLAHVPSPDVYVAHAAEMVRSGGLCLIQVTDASAPLARLLRRWAAVRRVEGWPMNTMTTRDISAIAQRHSLALLGARSYGLSLPGSGHVPFGFTRRLEHAAAYRPMCHLGIERLLLFGRE
jgi:hypothetical protein